MARVRKRITAKKAAQTFITYAVAVGGALATVDIPAGDLTDKALLTLGVSAVAAVLRAVNNVRKTRKKPQTSGYVVAFAIAGLAGLLSGCVTTTAPDGTTTTGMDPVALETAWATWERYEARRAALEAAKAEADAAERARIEAEIRRLEPEIARLAERLGLGE